MLDRAINAAAWFVVLFILTPLVVVIGGSVSQKSYVSFPPIGFTLRWYQQLLGREDFARSFFDSLIIASLCTVVATIIGVAAAIGFHRGAIVGREALRTFVISPLVLPTIITGVALLQMFYLIGANTPLLFLVIGHAVITVPYVVRTVGAGLVGMNADIEEAAESLGAGRLKVLLRVTLPAIAPSILASTIFVFIISFDQVTISIFLSGPDLMPLPIRIYNYIDYSIDPMVAAASTLLILFAFGIVAVLQKLMGIDRAFGAESR